eukprot:12227396-Ditylum_brightwellii.AAC.1
MNKIDGGVGDGDTDGDTDGNSDSDQRIWTIVTHHEDLSSVAASADKIKAKFHKIDLLINNAGLTYNPTTNNNMMSAHGKDLAFT